MKQNVATEAKQLHRDWKGNLFEEKLAWNERLAEVLGKKTPAIE